jgi:hypothetical protein
VQATALKLQDERAALEALVQEARERLESGMAPTEDADKEWQRKTREAETIAELKRHRDEVSGGRKGTGRRAQGGRA